MLTVPDPGLAALLASPSAPSKVWAAAWDDVKVLLQVLRKSVSLGHALAVGVVELLTPSSEALPGQVMLADGSIVLSGVAADETGCTVLVPHAAPSSVQRLAVADLTIGGRSGLKLAG